MELLPKGKLRLELELEQELQLQEQHRLVPEHTWCNRCHNHRKRLVLEHSRLALEHSK
ncbi:hypothetical protein Pan97_41010 [Bremerella volcania]|uniref:Uncharacterized protein n=1 Tax=Bremerella volcania TaxID=2527984 RepID=A0A518CCU9_9BACT|nr:hypothetical protein Pan97_41010 [Bremerella volcania]